MKNPGDFFTFDTSFGPVTIAGDKTGLTHLFFNQKPAQKKLPEGYTLSKLRFKNEVKAIKDYLTGRVKSLTALDWKLGSIGTEFQRKVWKELKKIHCGKTVSYRDIAEKLGSPRFARAVGGACNANPLLLLIPCHRVVATGGGLGGFALGLPVKEKLLNLESLASS